MADPNIPARDSNIVAWAPNLAFFGLIVGVFFTLDPLESPRPSIDAARAVRPDNPEEVYSRLWEDPFNPIDASQRSSPGTVAKQTQDQSDRELVCIMTLPQNPTSEASELRIRARYAAVSAILNSGFLETTPGVVKVNNINPRTLEILDAKPHYKMASDALNNDGEATNQDSSEDRIVLESFEPVGLRHSRNRPLGYRGVTLIFVPESLIFTDCTDADDLHPSRRLNTLFNNYTHHFFTESRDKDRLSTPQPDRIYVGPSDSRGFMAFASDVIQTGTDSVCRRDASGKYQDRAILWLSPWATISQSIVDAHLADDDAFGDQYTKFSKWKAFYSPKNVKDEATAPEYESLLRLLRTSCSDDCLSQAILDELMTRGLGDEIDRSKIVLVTEADSIYGKAFGNSFQSELDEKGQHQVRLETHTYLSGIDGRIASKQDTDDARRDLSQNQGNTGFFSQFSHGEPEHPPLGRQQYDRIRELAAQLKADQKHIFAVGVVGTDVYDKIVILEALKHQLPEAIFFTTDLDSMLTFKDYLGFTQNLLVASSYGFTLSPSFQGQAPPMRDTYQTAIFHSFQVALNDYSQGSDEGLVDNDTLFGFTPIGEKATYSGEQEYRVTPNPQIYEVTRQGARLLQVVREKDPSLDKLISEASRGYDLNMVLPILCWFIVLMVISLWPYEIRRFGQDNYRIFTWGSGIALAVSLVSTAILFGCFAYCSHYENQERFGWLDGASIWPTDMIRVGIIVMAIRYIEYAFCIIRKQLDRVCHALDSSSSTHTTDPAWGWIERTWLRAMRLVFVVERRKADAKHSCGNVSKYPWWIIPLLAFDFFLAGVIFRQVFGVFVPHRGNISFDFDITTQWIEGMLFSVLIAQCCYLAVWVEQAVIRPFRNYCNPDTDPPFKFKSQDISETSPPTGLHRHWKIILLRLRKSLGYAAPPDEVPRPGPPPRTEPGSHPAATLQVQMLELVSTVASKVESLVLCPFCLLLFVIFSENRLIDGWYIGRSLVAIGFSACVLLIVIASTVRANFSRLRNRVRRNIASANLATERENGAELPADKLLSRIESIGEMDSIWNNPIFGGLAIILTGAGGSQLMSMLFR
jgi:hypothetical protein